MVLNGICGVCVLGRWKALPLLLLAVVWQPAMAQLEWELNGFGSVTGAVLDDDSINQRNAFPHNLYRKDARYDVDSQIAVQGTAWFDDRFSVTGQVVAMALEHYDPNFEWAYLNYNLNDSLSVRAGRMRRPIYFMSDFLHVSYAYPWVRPPLEVYSRDLSFYSRIDALNLRYQSGQSEWGWAVEGYYGNYSGRAECNCSLDSDVKTRDDSGVVLELERNGTLLRFGYHRSPEVTITTLGETGRDAELLFSTLNSVGFGAVADELRLQDVSVEFFNLAAHIDSNAWLAGFEYIYVPIERSLAPDETSWYLMGGRRFDNVTVHYTYSKRRRNNPHNFSSPLFAQAQQLAPLAVGNPAIAAQVAGLNALAEQIDDLIADASIDQSSHTLGVRYDFDVPLALKAEYQRIRDHRFGLDNDLFSVSLDFLF